MMCQVRYINVLLKAFKSWRHIAVTGVVKVSLDLTYLLLV